jgi:hypothetical protein
MAALEQNWPAFDPAAFGRVEPLADAAAVLSAIDSSRPGASIRLGPEADAGERRTGHWPNGSEIAIVGSRRPNRH